MSDIAICAKNLSKQFRIGANQKKRNFREALTAELKAPFRRAIKLLRGQAAGASEIDETIWALKDVSFEIKQGEMVGIIGRNGSGKSTLLKVLSRITEPTEGFAEVQGRVGSLLEVGTGFHAELTGRENIYLNGAILGMKKAGIKSKFDEIVAFSEVERFIDTPVKRYSSGMYLRLAFAVAAHLEPEILLVDEVLAVGDIAFQKKCIGKMDEVAKEGRTILFVSHNMGAIANLCKSVIWLNEGRIEANGEVVSIINDYIKSSVPINTGVTNLRNGHRSAKASITGMRMLDSHNKPATVFLMGETVIVEFDVEFYSSISTLDLAMEVKRPELGMNVLHLMNHDCGFSPENIVAGKHTFRVEMPYCLLYPASYTVSLWVGTNGSRNELDSLRDALSFSMVQSDVTKRTTHLSLHKEAIFYMQAKWTQN